MLICATETCNVTLHPGFFIALVLDEGQRRSSNVTLHPGFFIALVLDEGYHRSSNVTLHPGFLQRVAAPKFLYCVGS